MIFKSFNYLQRFDEVNAELEKLDKEYRIEFNFLYVRNKKTPCVFIKSLCSEDNGVTANPIIYSFDWMDGDMFDIIAYFDSMYYDFKVSVDMDTLRTKRYLQENLFPVLVSADYAQILEANDILYTTVDGTDMLVRYGISTYAVTSGLDSRRGDFLGTLRVTGALFDSLEVESKEELYKMAIKNAGKDVNVYTFYEHMTKKYGKDALFEMFEDNKEDLWVVTNKRLDDGAVSILTEQAKEMLESVLGKRYLVCPINTDYCACIKWDGDKEVAEFFLELAKDEIDFVSHNLYIMDNKELQMYVSK